MGRLTVGAIRHDFLHALMHVDRSALSLVRLLFIKPSDVARAYTDGRRKRYFGPFAFLVIVVGLATAAIEIAGFRVILSGPNDAGALKPLGNLLQRHANALILLQVPLLAAFGRALFLSARTNFAEHLVLASYTSGMRSLVTTVVVLPCAYVLGLTGAGFIYLYAAYLLVWFGYFGFAMAQFLREPGFAPAIKGGLAAILSLGTTQLAVSVIATGVLRYSSHG